jgi:hypothetical protein
LGTNLINKLATGEQQGANLFKTFDTLQKLNNEGKLERGFRTIYSTLSESGTEAYGTFKDVKEELKTKRELAQRGNEEFKFYKNLSDAEIERKAGEAASGVFRYNLGALIAPNWIESSWFSKADNFTSEKIKKDIYSALKKGDPSALNELKSPTLLKSFLTGFVAEGAWEENIQESISAYYKKHALSENVDVNDSSLAGIASNYFNGLKGFSKNMLSFLPGVDETEAGTFEDHASTAIFLGGIMGGPSNAMTDKFEYGRKLGVINDLKQNW